MKVDSYNNELKLEPWERDWYQDNQFQIDKDAIIQCMQNPDLDYDVIKAALIREGYKNYEFSLTGR